MGVSVVDPGTVKSDLWVLDVMRGTSTRLTFDPESNNLPVWSPADRKIYFSGARSGRRNRFAKSSSETGEDEPVFARALETRGV